ncbi:hypothetical protein Tco_1093776 [Tanacetum coccineum]|uniref:Reverse transcriptase domain-containing protein n=1 Tax=Tanacetum coccineum TaxID=301880 RepID=A0ABQ5IFZ4_9ASTR
MVDSQSPEKEVRGTNSKDRGTGPRKGSTVPFSLDPHHPPSNFINKRKNMLKTRRAKPNEKLVEQWMNNEISFPSVPGCQLVDSPIILEALIEGFQEETTKFEQSSSSRPGREVIRDKKDKERDKLPKAPNENKPPEKVVIHDGYPDHTITIGRNLTTECRTGLMEILCKYIDAFAWTLVDMTGIPRLIAQHELKTYPHIEPRVQRKRSIASDKRKVVKEEVAEWLKAGIVRRVRYPSWVANPILVKKPDNSWRMCIDFKDLNKACPKDLYPLPEID